MADNANSSIILGESLRGYFYQSLSEINKKSLCPVPEETIYYSSEVLTNYSSVENLFEMSDGQVREKILGMKLLEASKLSSDQKKREYKEIADTALFLTGYFSKSIDSKLFDSKYYIQIGRTAYENMNTLSPKCYDIPSFYKMMSTCFESLTKIMTIFGEHNHAKLDSQDELMNLIAGIQKNDAEEAS